MLPMKTEEQGFRFPGRRAVACLEVLHRHLSPGAESDRVGVDLGGAGRGQMLTLGSGEGPGASRRLGERRSVRVAG